MKMFIFVTTRGTAYDDNGDEQENCQYLIIGEGKTAQEAWESCKDNVAGEYDSIFAFELASDKQITVG